MEIQQSRPYADYIRSLGWTVETVDGSSVFIKPFPLVGGIAKIQRVTTLPRLSSLLPVIRKYRVKTLVIEPDSRVPQQTLSRWCHKAEAFVRINRDPFIPTKTIRVALSPSLPILFQRFTEAKRRAVRRAEKHGITVDVSGDIASFIRLKNRSAGLFGAITTSGLDKLWKAIPDANKAILLARDPDSRIVGGIFLIFWNRIAYYWVAGAVREGKKLFAPTILVWEAMKLSKLRRCTALDFVGVWDERLPDKNPEWKGFTKFKEGFGGQSLYYPTVPR